LLEEDLPGLVRRAHAVRPALAGGRPSRAVRQHDRGDPGVVLEDVGLRRAGGRVEDLGEVGQAEPVAVDLDHRRFVLRHDAMLPAAGRTRYRGYSPNRRTARAPDTSARTRGTRKGSRRRTCSAVATSIITARPAAATGTASTDRSSTGGRTRVSAPATSRRPMPLSAAGWMSWTSVMPASKSDWRDFTSFDTPDPRNTTASRAVTAHNQISTELSSRRDPAPWNTVRRRASPCTGFA